MANRKHRVLGIDPGIGRTGVAVLEYHGRDVTLLHAACLETSTADSDAVRLARLEDSLRAIVDEWQPDEAAIEQLFFAKNQTTAFRVAQARGVILAVLGRAGVPFGEYTPMQVKLSVCGYGKAKKSQVGENVRRRLGVTRIPGHDDAVDAGAIALTHLAAGPLGVVSGMSMAQPQGMAPHLAEAVARAQQELLLG